MHVPLRSCVYANGSSDLKNKHFPIIQWDSQSTMLFDSYASWGNETLMKISLTNKLSVCLFVQVSFAQITVLVFSKW